jgi:hypothetical protein
MADDQDQLSAVHELLTDAFGRVRGLVDRITDGLTREQATYRPDPEANTVAWLVWHLTRIQDDHIADVAGVEQVYVAKSWHARLGLPFDAAATGFGQSSDDVRAVDVEPAQLAAYHADVHELTTTFLADLDVADLERVVDEGWNPPVTMSVRLVSVISDCLQHAGQAAYVRGLAERRA